MPRLTRSRMLEQGKGRGVKNSDIDYLAESVRFFRFDIDVKEQGDAETN